MNQSPPPPKKKNRKRAHEIIGIASTRAHEKNSPKTPSPPGRGMDIGIGPQEGHSISVTSARAAKNHWLVTS